jgi:WD40 repeat protein
MINESDSSPIDRLVIYENEEPADKVFKCGTQEGILSLFSKDIWCDVSDRYPGHPQSIDAILKIDEDTVLTGSSDGLVRAVQLLPNSLLGVLGGHDGFPVEALGWSAGRKMVGSVSHDEYIRLWVSFEGGCG